MGFGQGLAQGLRAGQALVAPMAEKRRARERQAQALAMFNLQRQAKLEDAPKVLEIQRQAKQQEYEDIGNLLTQLTPSVSEQYEGITPAQLGQAKSLGILDELKKQKSLNQLMEKYPELAQQIELEKAGIGKALTNVETQKYKKAQRELAEAKTDTEKRSAGLKLQKIQADIQSKQASAARSYAGAALSNQRAQYLNPLEFETVTTGGGTTGQPKVTYKRRKGQAGQSSADKIAEAISKLE